MSIISATQCSFWYWIKVYERYPNTTPLEVLHWDNMSADVRNKWGWYFKYRTALLRIKYPKAYIEERWGAKEINQSSPIDLQIQSLIRRRTTVRSKITQFNNAISKYITEEKMKLISDFFNPTYLRTMNKLTEYQAELTNIEQQLSELTQNKEM